MTTKGTNGNRKKRNLLKNNPFTLFMIAALACITAVSFTGCSTPKKVEVTHSFPKTEYNEAIQQGDEFFSRLHLYAWRKADEYYAKAYEMKKTPELRDKRFLTLCLIAMREKNERIVNPATYEKIDSIVDTFKMTDKRTFPDSANRKAHPGSIHEAIASNMFWGSKIHTYLSDLIQHYRSTPPLREGDPPLRSKTKIDVDITLFDVENSPLDAHLYMYFIGYFTYNFNEYNEGLPAFLEKHGLFQILHKHTDALSPLFLYPSFKNAATRESELEARYPQFAEFLYSRGAWYFKTNKLKNAAVYFKRVLELIPDYVVALNAMGNIYYFTVNDYNKALSYYDKTLQLDELNPVALFGKGVSLHFLERFEESHQVLDLMLEKQKQYHGQAYYYKSYNYYRTFDLQQAQEMIVKALELLPKSGEVNFLAGLIHYDQGNLKDAENGFLRAICDPSYANGFPLYYLGMIKYKSKKWNFFNDFTDSIEALQKRKVYMKQQIEAVNEMDVSERDREWLKMNRGKALESFKETAGTMIAWMERIMDENRDKRNKALQQEEDRALSLVKSILKKDPGALNRLNDEGSTLLNKAIQEGRTVVAQYLISRGARMDIPNQSGYFPLHWAVMTGNDEIAELLIRKGADVNKSALLGMTPLHDAAYGGYVKIVHMLLDAGADPYAENDQKETPLFLAVRQGKRAVFHLLRPLHEAVEKGNLVKVKTVLSEKPELLNSKDEVGKTLLVSAAARGQKELVRFLLDYGAEVNARDFDGKSALDWSTKNGHQEIVGILMEKGAKLNDDVILKKQMADTEAAVWTLNGFCRVVKTQNHLLVFDYPLGGDGIPIDPAGNECLANGYINLKQLKGQRVTFFVSTATLGYRYRELIKEWRKTTPNVTFVYGWQAHLGKDYIIEMKPEEKRVIDDMDVVLVGNERDGSAFMVTVDGISIFYGQYPEYSVERTGKRRLRDVLSGHASVLAGIKGSGNVNLAFITIPKVHISTLHDPENGIFGLMENLTPEVIFPFFFGMDNRELKGVSESIRKRGFDIEINTYQNRGDRFDLSFNK